MARYAVRWHGKPCVYCARPMNCFDPQMLPTRDHTIPRSRGGKRTIPACWQCNNAKGSMMPAEWAAFMALNPKWWQISTRARSRWLSDMRRNGLPDVPTVAPPPKPPAEVRERPLTGRAAKAFIRSVIEPAVPLPPSGRLIYSTDPWESPVPASIEEIEWPWLRGLLAYSYRNGSRIMIDSCRVNDSVKLTEMLDENECAPAMGDS